VKGSVEDSGHGHQQIEPAQEFIDAIARGICGDEFREVVAKGDGYRTVEIGAGMRRFVGEFKSVDAGVFDYVIILAVIDDLHVPSAKLAAHARECLLYGVKLRFFKAATDVDILR